MKYIVNVQENNPIVPISELPDGTLAIATDGRFIGELFYKNVAGVVGISSDRYWPSAYMAKNPHQYIPYFNVRAVSGNITISVQDDEKTALKATESGAVIDYRDWLVKRINRKRKTNVLGIS